MVKNLAGQDVGQDSRGSWRVLDTEGRPKGPYAKAPEIAAAPTPAQPLPPRVETVTETRTERTTTVPPAFLSTSRFSFRGAAIAVAAILIGIVLVWAAWPYLTAGQSQQQAVVPTPPAPIENTVAVPVPKPAPPRPEYVDVQPAPEQKPAQTAPGQQLAYGPSQGDEYGARGSHRSRGSCKAGFTPNMQEGTCERTVYLQDGHPKYDQPHAGCTRGETREFKVPLANGGTRTVRQTCR